MKELHKKRELKRQDVQRVAEQEIRYLHDNGKVTKPTVNKSNLQKKSQRKPGGAGRTRGHHSQQASDEEGSRNNHDQNHRTDEVFEVVVRPKTNHLL